jgi:hypothetical protein
VRVTQRVHSSDWRRRASRRWPVSMPTHLLPYRR